MVGEIMNDRIAKQKLNVILMIDCSTSMRGVRIKQVNDALKDIQLYLTNLQNDNINVDFNISVITVAPIFFVIGGLLLAQLDKKKEETPEFKDNSANFKQFTEAVEETKPEETQVEEVVNQAVEEEPVAEHVDEVEDISVASQKPIIDEEDIPPFLRKLRK